MPKAARWTALLLLVLASACKARKTAPPVLDASPAADAAADVSFVDAPFPDVIAEDAGSDAMDPEAAVADASTDAPTSDGDAFDGAATDGAATDGTAADAVTSDAAGDAAISDARPSTDATADGGGSCTVVADLGSMLGPDVATGTTMGRTDEVTPACRESDSSDAIYTWTAPSAGNYAFSLVGSDYDTVLDVLENCPAGLSLACNDDHVDLQSVVRVDLTAGQRVHVVVDGYDGQAGNYRLGIHRCEGSSAGCVPHDIGTMVGMRVFEGTLAAVDPTDPCGVAEGSLLGTCGGGGRELVIQWTAPMAGRYVFDTQGSEYDTVLYARNGSCEGDELACNDDAGGDLGTQSRIQLSVTKGQVIVLVLDAFFTDAEGAAVLNITRMP
ncbi:MAG: hypothetical protein NZ898_11695 [Myxococcota bacterium]|nr:hypothetical protein [Myxococcota bacterium]MDW8362334.1 hypothetical protein [Myxococcales bacterium]